MRHELQRLGHAGAAGWRRELANRIADPVARATGLSRHEVRAIVGIAFVALALKYLIGTLVRLRRTAGT